MKRTILAIMLALALVAIPVSSALAQTTQDVTVTATPTFISITNLPISFDFDVVAVSTTPNTTTGWFTITNDSSITTDINIKCNGWSGAVNSWTYASPIGADQGYLAASGTFGGAGGSTGAGNYDKDILLINTDYLLCDDLAVGSDPDWEMELNTPSSFSYGDEQTTTVTLTASAS